MFVLDGIFELLPLLFTIAHVSFIKRLQAGGLNLIHFQFLLQIFLHVLKLIIKLNLNRVTRHLIKGNINPHGEVLSVVIFDSQKGVVGDVVVVLDGEEDEDAGGLKVRRWVRGRRGW